MLAVLTRLTHNSIKRSALVDLMNLPKGTEKCPHVLVQVTADKIKKGVIACGKRGPIQNAMLANENILADALEQLNLELACSIEPLCMLLGELDLQIFRGPLSMDKHFKPHSPTSAHN